MNRDAIIRVLPNVISSQINIKRLNELQEIRIRVGRQTIFKYNKKCFSSSRWIHNSI